MLSTGRDRVGCVGLVVCLLSACSNSGGPVDGATLERGCAALVACFGSTNMRRCTSLETDAIDVLPCLAATGGDCDRAAACAGSTVSASACAEPQRSCEGDFLVGCNPVEGSRPSYSFRADCRAQGLTCVIDTCSARTCEGASGRCDGNVYVECSVGREIRRECPAEWTCDAASFGCVPNGPPCSESRCEGDVAVFCAESSSYSADCSRIGQTCVAGAGIVSCEPTGTECDSTFVERCVGGVLEYCGANDTIETFDCGANGYTGCAASPTRCIGRGILGG